MKTAACKSYVIRHGTLAKVRNCPFRLTVELALSKRVSNDEALI